MTSKSPWNRRRFLQTGLAGGAVATGGLSGAAFAQGGAHPAPKFLIVLGAFGGANIIDSFMAMPESRCETPETVTCYPDSLVQKIDGTPFTAIDYEAPNIGAIPAPVKGRQSEFVKKHHQDMMVVTHTGTSVNHGVAQHRSVNGNAAWYGRTLQEAVAMTYGGAFPIANVHLCNGTAFTESGTDAALPGFAMAERAPSPNLWPLALDGYKGVAGAPPRDLFEAARNLRNQGIDPSSEFFAAFGASERVKRWTHLRGEPLKGVEAADLITKLMLFPDSEDMPLSAYGLKGSDIAVKVRDAFPKFRHDPLEAQAALAFMLLRYGVAVTVTIGPEGGAIFKEGATLNSPEGLRDDGLVNPPVAFDYSHSAHRETQAMMWGRTLSVADRLITLLKAEEYADGGSYWDRSMIYMATEFGRTRTRPSGASTFGTGHDLNNGSLILSPMVNGNTVLGGVDTASLKTYGFDPATGAPDPNRNMAEAHIYAGIAQSLGIDVGGVGLSDMRSMRRRA